MSFTDPIADMFTRIRNAVGAKHDSVIVPSSKEKVEIAKILKSEGYITDFVVDGDLKKNIVITLKYGEHGEKVISGIKRISKPGLRVYAQAAKMPRVLNGLGIAIVSTSQGMMTGKQAKANKVGGEVIAYVW
jgi:small subunit ribosomal protein S8